MSIRPLSDRVVVEAVADAERTSGGLYIPEVAREKPQRGRIIATGPGRVTEAGEVIPISLYVGDEVLHPKFVGIDVTVADKQYLILRESDVLAVVT